ncbi:hypothetical protein Y032_0188g1159 [Ancylostoma ceylanicum]|uniref:Uncharacterized protein n=1 Tax=Ancylostoma ceylanicum TaxID=53326 RepID=A0A016SRH1_9BILA|nr:hypothetical protein Y032_0188g1159 [Ancylostoma ceylanicum]
MEALIITHLRSPSKSWLWSSLRQHLKCANAAHCRISKEFVVLFLTKNETSCEMKQWKRRNKTSSFCLLQKSLQFMPNSYAIQVLMRPYVSAVMKHYDPYTLKVIHVNQNEKERSAPHLKELFKLYQTHAKAALNSSFVKFFSRR